MIFKQVKEEKTRGINKGALFFSNSLEVLLEHLKANLFPKDKGLFSERLLIVPSYEMQRWIHMQLASSLSIVGGINTTYLDKGVSILCEKIFCWQKKYFLPTSLEIFLKLEKEIESIQGSEDPLWRPLKNYVFGKEKRRIALAKILTKLFEKYGIYGSQACVEWETNPSTWQEALWSKIFQDWDYPQRILPLDRISQIFSKYEKPVARSQDNVCDEMSVHIFSFSHLSPLHYHFFCTVSRHVPLFFYQLSPCQEFWSDLSIDYPSLLGSMGKIGRGMARLIEDSESPIEESYVVFGGNSQLRQLQRSLLTLQTSYPSELTSADESIQIHSCATPHLEIHNLYNLLHALFLTGTEPKDVIVMAPQMSLYTCYIQAIFGNTIPFQIADVPIWKGGQSFIHGFFLFLELNEKRWSAPAVLALFDHSLFKKKHALTEEDLTLFRTWIQKTGVRWGVDGAHRAELLKKGHCLSDNGEESSTWLGCFGHLIDELAMPFYPERINFSEAETLGKILHLIQSMRSDLKTLDEIRTLLQWADFLQQMAEKYFWDSEESTSFGMALDRMRKAGKIFNDQCYGWALIDLLLKEYTCQECITVNSHLCQAVHFCSMLPMRAIPAKVICLIGLNHDSFPRKEMWQMLDLLKENSKGNEPPSKADVDRYLFLEAILSAREKLIISYIGSDPFDHTELPPSSTVCELLRYVSNVPISHHRAQDLSHVCIKEPLQPFSIKVNTHFELPQGEIVVDIIDLDRLIRSPLRHFLYWQDLKIYQEEMIQQDEPFVLSTLTKAKLRKLALQEGVEVAYQMVQKESALPLGILGSIAKRQIEEELDPFKTLILQKKEIVPFSLKVTDSLTIIFTGTIQQISADGMYVAGKLDIKNAVKAWPHFLLLNAGNPTLKNIFFSASPHSKTCFFSDPRPFLLDLVTFFFYAKKHTLFLTPDWIEPILSQDVKKLEKAPNYDPILLWYLRGRGKVPCESIIEAYYPWIHKLFGEMRDAWF